MNIRKSEHALTITYSLEDGPVVASFSGVPVRIALVEVRVHARNGYSLSVEGPKLKKDGTDSAVWTKPYVSFVDLPSELKPLIDDALRRHAAA